jgi:methylphosphotriester-DNA--protein-cysteine methyltransferase
LSYHRTSHFFAETVGVSIRTYQLWQKLYKAGAPLIAGASLTDAAHAAGFVDSAHYSRAFQTAFGRCPTKMFKTRHTTVFFSNAFRDVPMFDAAAKR